MLKYYGVTDTAFDLTNLSYWINEKQHDVLDSRHSGYTEIYTWVPQGSVLSPLFLTSVTNTLSSIVNESIEIRPLDIVNVLKRVNKRKACGVNGLAAEHFTYLSLEI